MDEPEIRLTPGWRYAVHSQGSGDRALESLGRFRGYSALGQESALAIELDEGPLAGRIRLLPVAAVLWIDLLESSGPREEERPDSVYFG